MQALKMFGGGQGGSASGGGAQNQYIGMAMAQASKLFGKWWTLKYLESASLTSW